jgi:L-seryl-tRNA(Ser) seleniumtransferase
MYDLGSGALVPLPERGLPAEPTVQDAVAAGTALVTFSGDKLLGGPQAGLLVGRANAVERCRRHPLARAVRIGRLDLAALAATLRHYLTPDEAWREIPVLRMLAVGPEELAQRARRLADRLKEILRDSAEVTVVSAEAQAGGGALPGVSLPSAAVLVRPRTATAEAWAASLRQGRPPVIMRIQDDALLLNLRTLAPEELEALEGAFAPLR